MAFTDNPGKSGYALIGADGEVISLGASANEVAADAPSGAQVYTDFYEPPGMPLTPNATLTPRFAHRRMGDIRIDYDAVSRLSVDEAARILQPLCVYKDGEPVEYYASGSSFSRHILGKNYKTAKEHPTESADVLGLSFVPHGIWYAQVGHRYSGVDDVDLCVGKSRECRDGCLAFTGQNAASPYNDLVKLARTSWFMLEPEAFARLLLENIAIHEKRCKKRGDIPCVRLNVLSDIPWELVFPELFERFPGVRFYDYTKVPGRKTPANYDLTFSYSGRNQRFCDAEIDRGRRVAVVFLCQEFEVVRYSTGTVLSTHKSKAKARRWMHERGLSGKESKAYVRGVFPRKFMGLDVIDGDVSDVRPLDPAPVIVGLTWKDPRERSEEAGGAVYDKISTEPDPVFVVRVQRFEGTLVAAQVPRLTPRAPDADDVDRVGSGRLSLPILGR